MEGLIGDGEGGPIGGRAPLEMEKGAPLGGGPLLKAEKGASLEGGPQWRWTRARGTGPTKENSRQGFVVKSQCKRQKEWQHA